MTNSTTEYSSQADFRKLLSVRNVLDTIESDEKMSSLAQSTYSALKASKEELFSVDAGQFSGIVNELRHGIGENNLISWRTLYANAWSCGKSIRFMAQLDGVAMAILATSGKPLKDWRPMDGQQENRATLLLENEGYREFIRGSLFNSRKAITRIVTQATGEQVLTLYRGMGPVSSQSWRELMSKKFLGRVSSSEVHSRFNAMDSWAFEQGAAEAFRAEGGVVYMARVPLESIWVCTGFSEAELIVSPENLSRVKTVPPHS